jgi:hypothetical protein
MTIQKSEQSGEEDPEDGRRVDARGQIKAAMADLRRLTDVVAVAIARRDGLLIAHDLPKEVDPKKAAAMTAAIVGTSEMAAGELGHGRFLQAIVDSEFGKMLSTGAGEEALLVTLVRPEANMGLVLLGVERAARRIAAILSQEGT